MGEVRKCLGKVGGGGHKCAGQMVRERCVQPARRRRSVKQDLLQPMNEGTGSASRGLEERVGWGAGEGGGAWSLRAEDRETTSPFFFFEGAFFDPKKNLSGEQMGLWRACTPIVGVCRRWNVFADDEGSHG